VFVHDSVPFRPTQVTPEDEERFSHILAETRLLPDDFEPDSSARRHFIHAEAAAVHDVPAPYGTYDHGPYRHVYYPGNGSMLETFALDSGYTSYKEAIEVGHAALKGVTEATPRSSRTALHESDQAA